jgi:hypothetical protein
MPPLPEDDRTWTVRARAAGPREARAYCGRHAFSVGAQVALGDSDPHPSAVEYLLGALAGDLIQGFHAEAVRRSLALHDAELSLGGRLNNVLVHLGVVGEEGHPGLESVNGTLYVSADAEPPAVQDAWNATLARSPVFQTLTRCASVHIELRATP